MAYLKKISCEDIAPDQESHGCLMLVIRNLFGFGEFETSIYTLDKHVGRLIFFHYYKKVSYVSDSLPKVVSFQSVPISTYPGEHLYTAALSEMLDFARQCPDYTDGSVNKQKALDFIKKLESFLTQPKTEAA